MIPDGPANQSCRGIPMLDHAFISAGALSVLIVVLVGLAYSLFGRS